MKRLSVIAIVAVLVLTVSIAGASRTLVFFKTPTLDLESITINYVFPTDYVHAGLIVNGLVIEAGPWGLCMKDNFKIDYENAVLYDTGLDLTRQGARTRAFKVYTGTLGWCGAFQIYRNLTSPGSPYEYDGMSCFDFVGAFLGLEGKKPVTPLDILNHVRGD